MSFRGLWEKFVQGISGRGVQQAKKRDLEAYHGEKHAINFNRWALFFTDADVVVGNINNLRKPIMESFAGRLSLWQQDVNHFIPETRKWGIVVDFFITTWLRDEWVDSVYGCVKRTGKAFVDGILSVGRRSLKKCQITMNMKEWN